MVLAAGKTGSAIIGTSVANAIHNKGRWWKQNVYTGKGGAIKHIITGKPYPLTAILRIGPAMLASSAFELGVEAGHYIPAYKEAW